MCNDERFDEDKLPQHVREKIADMIQADQVIDLARRQAATLTLLGVGGEHDLLIDGPPVFVYHR